MNTISKVKDFSSPASVAVIIVALQPCNLIKPVTLSEIFHIPSFSQPAKSRSREKKVLGRRGITRSGFSYPLLALGPPVRRQCGENILQTEVKSTSGLVVLKYCVCAVIVRLRMGFHAQGGAFTCAHIPFYQRLKESCY